ncbi:HIRAN domain-containing protein [Phycicoccus sp.]|uniref:HIRAN domain-containing protein n=1 Tax=Phycicoccus sp. TaxID=1902410 RepID=UPI002D1FA3CE|nr:HIRAN domain-containing protein [Phycicoccus sp.]
MGWLDRFKKRDARTGVAAVTSTQAHPSASRQPSWYVPSDGDPDRFLPGPDGFPPLHLIDYRDSGGARNLRLCEDSTGLLVGPTDRRLFRAGVYSYNVRGESYHRAACRRADLRPGRPVQLVREPENKHDPNAVAVRSPAGETLGYISKGHAKRLAKLLDAGLQLDAVSVRGEGPGTPTESVAVVAATPAVLAHLLSPRPRGLPRPVHGR